MNNERNTEAESRFVRSVMIALNRFHESSPGVSNESINADFIRLAIAIVRNKRATIRNNVINFTGGKKHVRKNTGGNCNTIDFADRSILLSAPRAR